MSDMEIMKSAGLYQEDFMTGKSGFNLAAILLFGKDDIIRSCTANYVTDAICRKENVDRYDDRLIVRTNLIEAYEQLSEFIAKHTSDNFFVNIGRADALGSGVRNLYKYTKMYSGGEPELNEDDVFKTVIPLKNIKVSDKILGYLDDEYINAATVAELIDRSPTTARRILRQMVENNVLISMGGNKNRIYKKSN